MQLISKYNKEIQFLLCAIVICSKHAWVVPLKDKKGITITNVLQTSPWELMDPWTKKDSDKTQDICIHFDPF